MNHYRPPSPPPDVPRLAWRELRALAAAARPDWDPHELHEALICAQFDSRTWGQVLVEISRLMTDPHATPSDLTAAAPKPWRHRRPAPQPDTAHRGAAAVRAALHAETDT